MKRWIIIALTLVCAAVQAQDVVRDTMSADTTDEEPNVIGAYPSPQTNQRSQEINIIGSPVYYDLNGNVIGSQKTPQTQYHRPKHHYFNSHSLGFCNTFLELKGMVGREFVAGLALSYVPGQWGIYSSFVGNNSHRYLSMGPIIRLSNMTSDSDFQIYGGLLFSSSMGSEIGIRLAENKSGSKFCWLSGTVGMAKIRSNYFLTFGLSLQLSALTLNELL